MDLLVVKISIITGNFPDRRFSILLLSILIHERWPVCTVDQPMASQFSSALFHEELYTKITRRTMGESLAKTRWKFRPAEDIVVGL